MKISVLTPTFQSGPYLERAIKSVLIQNDDDFEHIIVDGGSSDETLEILKRYPHLKWISEPDQGQSDAMNKSFDLSSGEIMTYLNADDWFEPGVFSHIRSLFQSNPQSDIVVGNFYSRFEGRNEVHVVVPVKNYKQILLHFRYRFPLNPVCYFYRRAVQEAVGRFPENLHYAMDYWFLLRAFARFRVTETGLVMGTFFQTGQNKTSQGCTSETPSQVVLEHLRVDRPEMRFYYYRNIAWNRYVREFPERMKAPFRDMAYRILFASKMSRHEFQQAGFRKAWLSRFKRRNPEDRTERK